LLTMNEQHLNDNNEIPEYSVTPWEVILIIVGAIAVIGTGLLGLGIKALNNAFNPERADAIARNLIDYQIPGESQGIFGLKLGGSEYAWVRSNQNPPEVILFIGKIVIDEERDIMEEESYKKQLIQNFTSPPATEFEGSFITISQETEEKKLCGKSVKLTVEKGEQTFKSTTSPLPAIRYITSRPDGDKEQIVILTTNGQNAQQKAQQVFNSLRCRNTSSK
ncbi:MAG: hypothetical protein RLZZ338_3587, partial [Cyanobacteriota bacterium]